MSKTATVTVRLVVEVESHGAWGEDCTIGQARKQGVESALARLRKMLEETTGVRIVNVDATHMRVRLEEDK